MTASFFELRLAVSPFETEGYRSMSQTSAQTVTMIEVVFPDQTNHYARRTVVTACSERVDFQAAVRHGSFIELTARVVATGRSSMTVGVDLVAEDLLSGDRQLDAQGRFVLVALDENQRPTAVPPVSASPNQLSANKGTV